MQKKLIAVALDLTWPPVVPPEEWAPSVLVQRRQVAEQTAAPIRAMFAQLADGFVDTIGGRAVMTMPGAVPGMAVAGEWVEIAPAILGWVDCWQRLAPHLPSRALGQLARFLSADMPLTADLVATARAEFEAHVAAMPTLPYERIRNAVLAEQISAELKRAGVL